MVRDRPHFLRFAHEETEAARGVKRHAHGAPPEVPTGSGVPPHHPSETQLLFTEDLVVQAVHTLTKLPAGATALPRLALFLHLWVGNSP